MTPVLITPSYGRDIHLFSELRSSMIACDMDDIHHVVVVPRVDLRKFQELSRKNLEIIPVEDLMSRYLTSVQSLTRILPGKASKIQYVTRHGRPWPVRGWIVQQLVKLAVASTLQSDVTLIVDSDVTFLRRPQDADVAIDGRVKLYERPSAVGPSTQPQRSWIEQADRLLGISSSGIPTQEDYICGVVTWAPSVVRGLLRRIERQSGQAWQVALASQSSISECMLYGRYARVFADQQVHTSDESGCVTHWQPRPMATEDVTQLVGKVSQATFSVQLQSTAGMDLERRRQIVRILRAAV